MRRTRTVRTGEPHDGRGVFSLGALKAFLVLVLIALALVVNTLAPLVVDRFALKLDLTESRLYQISPATRRTVELLASPVLITVFSAEQDFPVMLREMLAGYARLGTRITVSYKDPFGNPKLVDNFLQRGTRILRNDVVVEAGGRFKRFAIEDFYTFNSAKTEVTGVRTEQVLTAAMIQLQGGKAPVVRFSDGHNETPSEALMDLFSQNSYMTERITLSVSAPGAETDMLVIASPARDFSGQEIAALDAYMNQGGSLMVFLAPSDNTLPNLFSFLERWGIFCGSGVVFEPKAHISDNRINIVPMYARHEINVYFGDKRFFLLMPSARILRPVDNPSYDLEVMTVLVSTPDAYAKTGMDFASPEKENGDPQGPFSLAVTASREISAGPSRNARLFAVGSGSIQADDVLAMSSFANGDFLVQAMKWLNPEQETVHIPAKTIASEGLTILPGEAVAAGIMLTVIIPALILVAGVAVAMKRRRS